ncbi:MAG TPA: hypothetical protein PLS63_13620, partial [Microthrixaceae bacterium]|nr:hypothetical protein [Microthrixaceae bacterium]
MEVLADADAAVQHLVHLDADLGGPRAVHQVGPDEAVDGQDGSDDVGSGQGQLALGHLGHHRTPVGVAVTTQVLDVGVDEVAALERLGPRCCGRQRTRAGLDRRFRCHRHGGVVATDA